MDERERRIRQRLKDDFVHYADKCLMIRSKSGEISSFKLNRAQQYIHEQVQLQKTMTGKVRAIILKGRQQGCSTYIEGRFFWLVTHSRGLRAFILTHDFEATNNLFEMAQRYYQYCPTPVKPEADASNAKELIFGLLDSGYKVGTAGNKSVGRSSTIQLLHGSEVAYWPNALEHSKGILQAVPNERGTEIFIESTANGIGNYFHEQWQLAESKQSDFIPIFVPWYWQTEYSRPTPEEFELNDDEEELMRLYGLTIEQINWRRYKIIEFSSSGMDGKKAFAQEYPSTAAEAFQSTGEDFFIDPHCVVLARKSKAEPIGPLLIGVDPARYGDDRTSIIRRRGRVAFGLQSFTKKSTMEVAGLVHRMIIEETPTKVCIDIGGLGAGVYDRLIELGHRDVVIPVNGGTVPLDQKKYYNKRAEMWGLMKEWLLDGPVQIPDLDTLHADLCNLKYTYDSKSRLLLEKKELAKKRGVRSPDEADALALTFAVPPSVYEPAVKQKLEEKARNVTQLQRQMTRMSSQWNSQRR